MALSFLRGKFGVHRLYGVTAGVFLLFIVYLDVRPATTAMGQISAKNFNALNCDAGCYAFGSNALRVLIDGRGVIRMVFFDSKALTAFTVVPALLVLSSVDYVSASMLASVYVAAVIQAKSSVPKLQLPIIDVPRNTTCLIIGVNDYVESYRMRWNHSCGYINYIYHGTGTGTAEKENVNAKIFAQAVERYGDLYDLVFLDRGAGVDIGMVISSVPKWSMGMGEIFEASETIRSTSGMDEGKFQKRVLVSRLRDVPDVYHEKIDGLKRWAAWQDSAGSSEEATLSKIFATSIPNVLGKLCSGKYFNIRDCLRNRADSVVTIHWDEMVVYALYLVGLYAIYIWMLLYKVKDSVGLYFQTALGVTCMFLGALAIGALGASPDDWVAWYSAGEGNLHLQNIILVALVSRSTLKACGTFFIWPAHDVMGEPDQLDIKLDMKV